MASCGGQATWPTGLYYTGIDPFTKEEAVEEALKLNQSLATVYSRKEDLRQIGEQADQATAARVLDDGNRRAEASCINVLQKFAGTLSMHRTGILAY